MGALPRSLRGLSAALAFAIAAGATVWACIAMAGGMPMPGAWMMSMAWMRMPGQSWVGAFVMFEGMWIAMMVAMMMPSFWPVVLRHRRPLRVACGYFAVWSLVGLVVYPIGIAIATAAMAYPAFARAVPFAIGGVLIVAGVVQLSAWKARALGNCRDRACCALGRRPDARQAWRDGLRLGGQCVRCCAPAMCVLLALGVMDPVLMGALTIAIAIERLVPRPRLFRYALGISAIAAGAVLIVSRC